MWWSSLGHLWHCLPAWESMPSGRGLEHHWIGRYRQGRKTISDCMDDKNTIPYFIVILIQKEDLLQSLVAEKSMFSEFFIFRGFVLLGLSALMSMFSSFDIFSCSMMFRGGCPCSSQRLEERA